MNDSHLKTIGILGDGQLARMLTLSAHRLGMNHWILGKENSPAASVSHKVILGDAEDPDQVAKWLRKVDIVTFESDYSHPPVLSLLMEMEADNQTIIRPSATLFSTITHRVRCKKLLEKYNFTVSPYLPIPASVKTFDDLAALMKPVFPPQQKAILKLSTGGYDGRGTCPVNLGGDASNHAAGRFLARHSGSEMMVEAMVPFHRELAITAVRSACGDIYLFPLVETKQTSYQCDWVKGPVITMSGFKKPTGGPEPFVSYGIRISDDGEELVESYMELVENITKFLDRTGYIGAVAFELFDVDGKLVVNEISPRVHNSCHYSMDAMSESQFDLHLKAITGLPLGVPRLMAGGFAMANLIGSESVISVTPNNHTTLHWYGKKDNFRGRKMGHLNALASDKEQALKVVLQARKAMSV